MKKNVVFCIIFQFLMTGVFAQTLDTENFETDGMECTTVTVGRLASKDGSVMTSHTDDSHRSRTNMLVESARDYEDGAVQKLYKRVNAPLQKGKPARYENVEVGAIPQVKHTFQFLNTAYPCLNEKQLAIGESTFGGRAELRSDSGLIDCQQLCMLMLQRCSTARQAIRMAGELLEKYGWIDGGECLTIADKNEVWHFEVLGPGKGKLGAVWAAQRVPDDHVAVNANASTIREIDLKNGDYFMASKNVFSLAQENGWYDPKKETFRFAYAYAPQTRTMVACRRREWRVFDLLAPSLHLDPESENYPFSVKPDSLVTKEMMVRIFKDYYEGTEYDLRKNLTVTNAEGKTVISPMANPFMKSDELKLHKINGGWHWRGERSIAVHFTVYATIIQCRADLPDEIGGVCWFALDNVASSIYVPIYGCVTELPKRYETDARLTGFSHEAAWWGFNRLGTMAAQRWGDMHKVIDEVWNPMQQSFFDQQAETEREALQLLKSKGAPETKKYLTQYSNRLADTTLDKAWETGDYLWTVFDGLW